MDERKKQKKIMDDLFAVLPYWYFKVNKTMKQSLNSEMSLETYYCLQTLRREGAMTMTEIAHRLKVPKQQATKLIGKLYDHQFVDRLQDDVDKRCIRIQITETAIQYLDRERDQDYVYIEQLKEQIGLDEMLKFGEALEILLEILPKLE